jgi:hypothetical protein
VIAHRLVTVRTADQIVELGKAASPRMARTPSIRLLDDIRHALGNAELTDLLEEIPLVTREDGRVLLPPYGVRILSSN